jgi:hypothetical protein
MDVPLKHVIGTLGLLGLVLAVGLSYQIIVSFVEANVMQTQLSQITENVSLNLVEIISLVDFGNFSRIGYLPMIKTIDLPADLGGKAYLIRLLPAKENDQSEGYYVQAEFVTGKELVARAPIPVNSTSTKLIVVTSEGTLTVGQGTLKYSGTIYAGNSNTVVWGYKNATYEVATGKTETYTLVGIGQWIPSGGT